MKPIPMRAALCIFSVFFSLSAFAEEDSPFPHVPARFACAGNAPQGLKTEGAVEIVITNISLPEEDLLLWSETKDGKRLDLEMTVERVVPYSGGSGFKIVGHIPNAWAPGRASPAFQLVIPPHCPSCPATFMASDNKNYRYQTQLNCSY